MKIEFMLLAHTIYSGAGTLGSAVAFTNTDMGMLLLPLSAFSFMLLIDLKHIIKERKRLKASD